MKVKLRIGKHVEAPKMPALCAGCSSAIAPDATFCEVCHAPIVRRYCAGCSRLIPENSVSCPYCGTSAKIKPRESNFGLTNIGLIAVVGMIAAYFLMIGFFPSEKPKVQQPVSQANPATVSTPAVAPNSAKVEAPKTMAVSNQPVVQSDEEGTKLNLKGYQFIQEGDYVNAEAVLRKAVQTFPQGTAAPGYKFALYNLGHVLRKTGHAKEAIPYLQKAANLDPAWSKAQTELAVAKEQAEGSKVL